MEIERKWLLRHLPVAEKPLARFWVEQFYTCIDPEIRLRRKVSRDDGSKEFTLTLKSDEGLIREETEEKISEEFYELTLASMKREPITKHLVLYNKENHTIGMNIVLDIGYRSFVYAEVEFESEEEAKEYQFPWPELVLNEVTENPDFKMKNYWVRTRFN